MDPLHGGELALGSFWDVLVLSLRRSVFVLGHSKDGGFARDQVLVESRSDSLGRHLNILPYMGRRMERG